MPDLDVLNNPTVMVLGAGASKPYGFPLGSELKSQIINTSDHMAEERNVDPALVKGFKDALRYGDYGTIDYFLERKKKYRELGAYYIVSVIARGEDHRNLFPQRDLYADIFHMLDPEGDSPNILPLSIVTLNYDRSLEHFLLHNTEYNCADRSVPTAHKKIAQLPIIHAHGSLGDLNTTPYGSVGKTSASLDQPAKSIKIISDKLEDAPDYQRAQHAIAEAYNILFLGFGYDERTLAALLAKTDITRKQVFGTAVGIRNEKKATILNFFKSAIWLGEENQDSSSFLEHLGIGRRNLKRK